MVSEKGLCWHGTPAGDQSATSERTLGGAGVEPFCRPDLKAVYFSSDRGGANDWVICSVPEAAPESCSWAGRRAFTTYP